MSPAPSHPAPSHLSLRRPTGARRPVRALLLSALAVCALALAAPGGAAAAPSLPSGFHDEAVFKGLTKPTIVRFAPDGRIFVAQLGGKIYVYDGFNDPEPELFADLSKPVYDFADHGLLGMALDPKFDEGRPYVYAIYTFNHELADPATQAPLVTDPKAVTPQWASKGPGFENDSCPEGEEVEEGAIPKELLGCEVSGLVVRLQAEGDHAAPSAAAPEEDVLLEGWCQQSTTHSIGDLAFGPEGNLFVSGGEGAMYSEPDYGQFGNPCEDPPEPSSSELQRPEAEGGSLRAQSVLRSHGLGERPTLLSGTVLRVDPDTGEGVAGNPFAASLEANARRIVGFGFRQPWRISFNPSASHLFVSNVGNGRFEEVDRLAVGSAQAYNGGWPCYEGPERNYEYAGEFEGMPSPSLDVCIGQYEAEDHGEPRTSAPYYSYPHSGPAVPGDPCVKPYTDVAGNAFYTGTSYPAAYRGAFFFADAIRGCIYMMQALPNGEPNPATATTFLAQQEGFVFPGIDLEPGPEGNLFYVEYGKFGAPGLGSIHRITYEGTEPEPGPPPTPPTPPKTYERPKIKKRPAKTTTRRAARFAFRGEPGLRFRCRLDGRAWQRCHSPRTYRHLQPRKHAFRVQGIDPNGKPLTKVTLFRWRVLSR